MRSRDFRRMRSPGTCRPGVWERSAATNARREGSVGFLRPALARRIRSISCASSAPRTAVRHNLAPKPSGERCATPSARRFMELVKRHHPDANGGDRASEDKLREIIEAYNYLKKIGSC